MKKIKVSLLALSAIAFGAFAFKGVDGSISGKVTPADGSTDAYAVLGADTMRTAVSDGAFSFKQARPGTYTVIIDAKEPFKDAMINDVKVEDGKVTDLGEIKLQQ